MRVLLTTFNSSYIHKNLALRWLYVARPKDVVVNISEYTIKDDVSSVAASIIADNYDVVGISVYIWNVDQVKSLIQLLKLRKPTIKIVLGGPEVTYENDEWFAYPIDAIVLGEGERVFWEYLINNNTDYVKEEASEFKPVRKEDIAYLESLDIPYNLEIDHTNFSNQYLYVEASRGCPFRCSYCLSSLDNTVRFFSLEYLENLFESVKDFPINQVKFLDRTFNAHKERTKALYKMLENYPNIESFQVEIVADRLDDDLIEMIINKSNRDRYRYEIGIQSYNPKTLEAVDRRQDNERLNQVMRILLDNDITIHADLIAGLPYEGLTSFQASFNQLANVYPTELQLGILKLLKGTKMKDQALKLNFLYNLQAPYEVYDTPWLNKSEMDYINIVAKGVDRTLNRNLLEVTVKYLNEHHYAGDLFTL
ncbi:MAG: B12-binding domain-containing radical SAM protein [Erysipelothrix sp.]|nr:B12-binding domain-containing radical SAM protein [Erysipelothrix sp.]